MKTEKWFGQEKDLGKQTPPIASVRRTYQVISVLLHCLTAEKPHKRRMGQRQHREIIVPRIRHMNHYYIYNQNIYYINVFTRTQ